MSAAAWWTQHRLRVLLPVLFMAPALFLLLSSPSSHRSSHSPPPGTRLAPSYALRSRPSASRREVSPLGPRVIWAQRQLVEWRPCGWWRTVLPGERPSRASQSGATNGSLHRCLRHGRGDDDCCLSPFCSSVEEERVHPDRLRTVGSTSCDVIYAMELGLDVF